MVNVLTEIDIARDKEIVAAYAANPDHAPEWYVNIKSAEWKTPKPLGVGSQVAFTAKFLGKELAYTYEITEYVPGVKLIMRTAEGPFPMETTYTWEATANGQTHMTLRNRGEPSGFSKLFAPLMSSAMKRANKKDLKKLKEILETR
jgi:hypothetical protein